MTASPTTQQLSVIVLTRNRLAKLERCLGSLLPQLAANDEVIVIDTGSADGTVERFAHPSDPRIKLHRFAGPGSWAEARNLGIDNAAHALIAFLDDDCYPNPDWADRGRAALADCDAIGGIAAAPRDIVWPDWWHPDMGWLIGVSVPGHFGPEAGRYFYPSTSNLWCRAAIARAERFQELGGEFAENEKERYHLGREDAEWWRRIRVRGYRTRLDPELRVEHDIDRARIDFDYLMERARRDGQAWAAREGIAEDLDHIAYRYWLATIGPPHEGGPRATPTLAERRLRELDRARQSAALDALAKKISKQSGGESGARIRNRALVQASLRIARDRAKTAGRRVVLAASPPRPRPLPQGRITDIGITAFGFVGDMVVLQSVIRGLVEANPQMRIRVLAHKFSEPILRGVPHTHPRHLPGGEIPLEKAQEAIAQWLGANPPQAIFAPYLHGIWGPALIRMDQPRIPIVAFDHDQGLKRKIDRERIPHKVEKRMTEHEARNLARLFGAAGIACEPRPARIELEPESLAWARDQFGAHAQPLLMLNPDAGQSNKEWPEESWAELARALLDDTPHVIVLNLSRDRPEIERLIPESPRVRYLRRDTLDRFLAVLSLCSGLITVDAGPQHLARALDVPTLTLYGPSDERRWGDFFARPIHQIVRGGMYDLTPEELRGLPENHLMRLIRPEVVVKQAQHWLAGQSLLTRSDWRPHRA